jgi:hypothetical protein
MPMFMKKPVAIEARQYTAESANDIAKWCSGYIDTSSCLVIPTLEGPMRALQNDWIIKGVRGEFYPCRESIFNETYERVEENG